MDSFEISIRKTDGGIGSDAWTASFAMTDGPSNIKILARGSDRAEARRNLVYRLGDFRRQISAAYEEVAAEADLKAKGV